MAINIRQDGDETHSIDLASFVSDLNTGKILDTECERLKFDPNRNLQQRDVLEVMMESDRPALTAKKVTARLKSDSSRETTRRRLEELVDRDVLGFEEFGNEKLYHVRDERSEYPFPGDAGDVEAPTDVGLLDLLLFREPVAFDRLATTSLFLAMYLILLGTLIDPFTDLITVEATNQFVEAGALLLLSLLPIVLIGLVVVKVREAWIRISSPH